MSESNSSTNTTKNAKQYKRVPFDIELAKKIQSGAAKGCIKSRKGNLARIVAWDMKCSDNAPILALIDFDGEEAAIVVDIFGKEKAGPAESIYDLVLEVPDNEPQFKPFDKVLVRDGDCRKWRCSLYSYTDENGHCCIDGHWRQCIPYDGNEHLVGTTNNFV